MTKPYNYSRIIAAAKRLIARFGGDVRIVTTTIVPNPEKWKPGTSSTSTLDVKGVKTQYEEKYIDGTLIQRDDEKVLISAAGVTFPPELTGYIMIGSAKWTIVEIKPLCPGDSPIIYTIQVRR